MCRVCNMIHSLRYVSVRRARYFPLQHRTILPMFFMSLYVTSLKEPEFSLHPSLMYPSFYIPKYKCVFSNTCFLIFLLEKPVTKLWIGWMFGLTQPNPGCGVLSTTELRNPWLSLCLPFPNLTLGLVG